MHDKSYGFSVGKFECIVLKDAEHAYEDPASFLFNNAPKEELKQVLRENEIDTKRWKEWVVNLNLKPLRDRFELIDKTAELVPGIKIIEALGHTPGHMIVHIASEGEQLWYLSDAFLHPVHIEKPDWPAVVDVQPEQAVITRHSLLKHLGSGQTLVHCFHFPFPGLGFLSESKEGYRWRPLHVTANG